MIQKTVHCLALPYIHSNINLIFKVIFSIVQNSSMYIFSSVFFS